MTQERQNPDDHPPHWGDAETEPMPLAGDRRQHRKLMRFDPTFTSGQIVQILALLGGFVVAYGTYREDRKEVLMEIANIKTAAAEDKALAKETAAQLRVKVDEVQKTVSNVDRTMVVIQAEINARSKGTR